jgi:hypothetical protein
MTLNVSKALSQFELADAVDLNCGAFDIRIQQAAVHNEAFRAAVAKRSMSAKRRSIVPVRGTLTGDFNEDVRLFCDLIVLGWGERPLMDDDGVAVVWNKDTGFELFTSTKEGRVLFGKVMQAAVSDEMFTISEEDSGNS